jgi:phosphatidylserine/phosphatidylglycerophosphate/cardiolipin synthase-like enzyme
LIRAGLAGLCLCLGLGVGAEPMPARGTVEAVFPPDDDGGAKVIEVVAQAKRQVLVQAYILTHRAIAEALVVARQRGVDVRVLADQEQAGRVETSLLGWLVERDVPVWLDGRHAAAHNKTMVIDAGQEGATVITGSFNFSHSAQYRNAENLLILRGHPVVAEQYADDWRRHRAHAMPMRK